MKTHINTQQYPLSDSWFMSVLKTLISSIACLLLFTTYSADLVTAAGVLVFIIGGIVARYHLETSATLRGISVAVGIWCFGFYGLSALTSESAVMGELATYLGLVNGKHLLLFSDKIKKFAQSSSNTSLRKLLD